MQSLLPDIIVLIPHYNDIKGLNRSLASISTRQPVDVLIVDDDSLVKPDQEELRRTHPHINSITVLFSSPNKGPAYVQNIGIRHILTNAHHKFIARLDQGDTCSSERFRVQREFLVNNPDVFLLGSHALITDAEGRELFVSRMPLGSAEIKRRMHAHCCFIHSSVMFRAEAIEKVGYYPTHYYGNDDYPYWFRFVNAFPTANIDARLVTYELHLNSYSRGKYRRELRSRIRILLGNFSFRYFFSSIEGLSKAFICYVIGVKLATRAAIIIGKFKGAQALH